MKLICISRVSDEDQIKSLGGQLLKLKRYAQNIDPKAEYHHFQESAHKDVRKKFAELVAHIKERSQKEVIGVVFCKVDRYTRGTTHQDEVRALNDLVKAGRIELHFCDDGLIVTKDSPATDLFRLGINVALAKYYSDTIRENVARRYAQMLHDGIWVGRAPLGFLNVSKEVEGKTVKNIIVDKERAPHIITIFEKRSTGMTYAAIAQLVNEAGLRSKSGNVITKSKIEQTTRQPFYYGTMLYMGKLYPHKYEPLITKDLYDKVQRVRDQRHDNRSAYKTIPFAFNGFVRCLECKCMISSYNSRNSTYLKCSKAKYKDCKNVSTPESVVLPQVEAMLKSFALSDENLQLLVEAVKKNHGNQQLNLSKMVTETREEYDKVTAQLKTLTYERLDSVKTGKGISAELFDEIVEELTDKQQELNKKLISLTDYNKTYLTTASLLLDLAQKANLLFKTSDNTLKQQLLRFLVYNVYLYNQTLSYTPLPHLRAFQALQEKDPNGSLKNSWLPAYDSLLATAMQLEDDALLQELAESFNLNSELLAV